MLNTHTKISHFDEAQKELILMQQEYLNANDDDFTDIELSIGCRVKCKYDNGNTIEGRVLKIKENNTISVNRDGFKSIMNFQRSNLINITVTKKRLLEKEIWLTEQKIEKLKAEIKSVRFDFLDFAYNRNRTLSFAPQKINVNIIELKKIKNLNVYSIKFQNEGNAVIRKTITTSPLFENIKEGRYVLTGILGTVIKIQEEYSTKFAKDECHEYYHDQYDTFTTFSSRFERFGGYNGFDDDAIDDVFEGDPLNTWNVD